MSIENRSVPHQVAVKVCPVCGNREIGAAMAMCLDCERQEQADDLQEAPFSPEEVRS